MPATEILRGEVALITGGGRGIGRAIAAAFAREGAAVALVARSADELASAARAIEGGGGVVVTRCADVTDETAMSNVVEDVREALGPITILVNNSGTIGPIGPFAETAPEEWWRCVEVNLRGPAICTALVTAEMAAHGRGRVINVVSGAGIISSTYYSAYAAAKTAAVRWTECVAAELRPYGVQLFAMEPGTVATAMSAYSAGSDDGHRWIPWFKDYFTLGLDVPMERVVQRAFDLVSGKGDVLSGRYLPLNEPLEELVANSERIREETLYSLRISRLARPPSGTPGATLLALRTRSEMPSPSVVRLRRRLPLDAHAAFDLWRNGETVAAWFIPPDAVEWLAPPTMDPYSGGRLDLRLSAGGATFHIHGTVVRATPQAGLQLRWSWESDSPILGSASDTKVTIEILPARSGVDVVITHEELPGEAVRDAYIRGWRRCLDGMARLAASR
jgi:NAD(P)-dependent dehydrogenase (short-subunit alcohol dehydrogenase family)/uncharacterized protein YndB with AHSA1/START domain